MNIYRRNILLESSRIARGNITDLKKLMAYDYHGLVIPGGFGAAKNLSNFAIKGPSFTVNTEMKDIIKDFHNVTEILYLYLFVSLKNQLHHAVFLLLYFQRC